MLLASARVSVSVPWFAVLILLAALVVFVVLVIRAARATWPRD